LNSFSTLLASLSPDNLKRGKQFEIACKWFLENDRRYSSLIEKVWLWEDWPDRWGRDCGIDLIAKGKDGKTWAIQAKCYDPEYHVTKKDVDSFLSESTNDKIDLRLLVTSTDNIGRNAQAVIARQNVNHPVRVVLRQDLVATDLIWPADVSQLISGYKPEQAKYKPRPHQEEAIQEVASKLDRRGQLIMASGTGKTLTALWIAEALNADRVLVLLPSLLLLSKTLQEWVNRAAEPFPFLPVCSDETAAKGADEIMSSTSELAFPSTTDPKEIAAFLDQPGKRIIFSTYQSSPRIAEAFRQLDLSSFDLVIADEAHRCAGKILSEYATVLDEASIPSAKRLFMTATPRVYMPHIMKKAADSGVDVASMDDESVFGPVLHRLTFGQAIDRELLTDYQVVIVGVDSPLYLHLVSNRRLVETETGIKSDAQTLASQVGLAKSIAKYNLRRVITFHSRVNWAKKFANELSEVITWMPDDSRPNGSISCRFVSGKMPTGERNKYLSALSDVGEGERYVLANAKCLSEGVDVPALDGIAFIDPKKSEIDIVQAVGRAIRLSKDKTVGTIVIPVFIEDDHDPEIILNSSEFDKVWKVVNALRAHDEQLGEQLDKLRIELGQRGSIDRLEKIHFDLPIKIDTRFISAFDTRLLETTTASWNFYFGLLQTYVDQEGSALVPSFYKTEKGFLLGAWVGNQRQDNRRVKLSKGQVSKLEALPGWVWHVHEDKWEKSYEHLQVYVGRTGNALVPQHYKTTDGFWLGRWVSAQRANRNRGELSQTRVSKLESLTNWNWDTYEAAWEEAFMHLRAYVEREGNTRVERRYKAPDGYGLGTWVSRVRQKKDQLSTDQVARLEALLGWAWDVEQGRWEQGYAHLRDYLEEHGNALVPAKNYETNEGFKLSNWVAAQRREKDKLSAKQIKKLEALPGWAWDVAEDSWQESYAHLKAYVEKMGDALVPKRYITADEFHLGMWVFQQRRAKQTGQITKERITRLEALPDWVWDTRDYQWEQGFRHLKEYAEREGHALIPEKYITNGGYSLGHWVRNQRSKKNINKLSAGKVEKLESVPGWVANIDEFRWERAYKQLQAYAQTEGNARVKGTYVSSDGLRLGQWVGSQRQKRSLLTADKKARLEALPDWAWSARDAQWEEGFEHLKNFVEKEGNALVPCFYESPDGFKLGVWVQSQRKYKKKETLSSERISRLEALPGWVWRVAPNVE
jgi:superfamily II DNA or RNA helicase